MLVFGAMATEKNKQGGDAGALGQLVKAESALQLALAIPGGCFIGWLIGTGLDKHFHTTWIVIVGILLGAVAGFIQMFALAMRFMKGSGK